MNNSSLFTDYISQSHITYQITYPNYDVIVVDNGSEDDSVKRYLYKKMTNFNLEII
jgi:cellulose synthase/poly-beta-1,6-N-acetylglucosamine synthase-like glycosyltransferase